ncbi:MAG TPA: tetratricopeptide repeat protein [Candidatus Omnitrophota bacterium]|nr:tetratricopeptide repeat protein [Candidatus Omnitrophota bacterium]
MFSMHANLKLLGRLTAYMIIGIALIVYVANYPLPFRSAASLYYWGKSLHNQKKFAQAEHTFKLAIKKDPALGKAHLMLGVVFNDQRRYREAQQEYEKALAAGLDPINQIIAYNNLGTTFLEHLDRFDEAIAAFHKALTIAPGAAAAQIDPYFGLARAYMIKADFDQAIHMARESVKQFPASNKGLGILGHVYLAKGDLDSARRTLETLAAQNKKLANRLLTNIQQAENREKKRQEFLNRYAAVLDTTENAALVYTDAGFKVTGVPPGEFVSDFYAMARQIFSRGWQKQDDQLRALLAQNQPALDQFRKAAGFAQCDFAFDSAKKEGLQSSEMVNVVQLFYLLALDAKRKEFDRDHRGAVRDYLSALQCLAQLGRQQGQGFLISIMFKAVAEQPVFIAIKGFVNRPDVSAADLRQVLESIERLNAGRRSVEQFVRDEIADHEKLFLGGPSFDELREKTSPEYAENVRDEYVRLAQKVSVVVGEAAKNNQPDDVRQKIDRLTAGAAGKQGDLMQVAQFFQALYSGKKTPQPLYVAQVWTAAGGSGYSFMIQKYYLCRVAEDLLAAGVALRLYELERGNPPDQLDTLVPSFLTEIPLDPYNSFKPFRYSRAPRGWIVYSVGPDRKDDRGTPLLDVNHLYGEGVGRGDFVF